MYHEQFPAPGVHCEATVDVPLDAENAGPRTLNTNVHSAGSGPGSGVETVPTVGLSQPSPAACTGELTAVVFQPRRVLSPPRGSTSKLRSSGSSFSASW